MFKTVKSKILITAVVMLAILMLAFGCYAIISRMRTKQLMVQNYKFSISSYVEDINESVISLHDNLKSLALIGNLYYRTDRSNDLTDRVITRIFENYPQTLGGGIWFKPYAVDKSKKYNCFYAFRDKNNKIVVDKNFSSDKYDYPNQEWYKQIISQVTPERNIIWTKPYYENQGSYTMMVTAGTGIYVDGKLVGIATVDWKITSIMAEVSKMKPLERTFSMYKSGAEIKSSFTLFGNIKDDYIVASTDPYLENEKLVGHSLKEIPWYTSANDLFYTTYINYHGKKYVPFVNNLDNGMVLIICLPKSEMFKDVNKFYFAMLVIMLLLGLIIPALLYYSLKRYIVNPIDKLTDIAHKVSKGQDVEIKLEKPEEFAQLASTFDKMTKDIKLITKEKVKINSELSIAKTIQASSLPNVFPPFPDRPEFDIYASMEPAKEVGGDFYDFYLIDKDNLMFLVADVSGKGIPAALFMMTVKTLINNMSQMGYTPKQLIESINKKICESNKSGLFVTLLAGIVNIKTGATSLINCGHNPPLIKRQDGEYQYIRLRPNIVLGLFEDSQYHIYETTLNSGDIIFTYTDGITESTNLQEEMYGEERLQACLNENRYDNDVKDIVNNVKTDIKNYVGSAPQSDDVTMLVFKYCSDISKTERFFSQMAVPENYKPFYTWLHGVCDEWKLNDDLKNKLDMCSEEIFANITFYAYPSSNGTIEIKMNNTGSSVVMEYIDNGIEYNPLEKPDPDITLPPEERPLGGLGIFMVKQMADDIQYIREENLNRLIVTFNL